MNIRKILAILVCVVSVAAGLFVLVFLSGWGFLSFQNMDGYPYEGALAQSASEGAFMFGGVTGAAIAIAGTWLATKIGRDEKTPR